MSDLKKFQDGNYCEYCNKHYKSAANLDKHRYLCKLMTEMYCEDIYVTEDIPCQRTLYFMLLELGKKYESLEKKMDSMSYTTKKKIKIKKEDFLNNRPIPNETCFIKFFDNEFVVSTDDVKTYLFDNKLIEVFNHILKRIDFTNAPVIAHEDYKNKFFGFVEERWVEMDKSDIHKILFRCLKTIFGAALDLKKLNNEKIRKCDATEKKFDNLMHKVFEVDVSHEPTYVKYRNVLFDCIKTKTNTNTNANAEPTDTIKV